MEFFKSVVGAPAPIGPYSAAVRVGNFLFCSGQIALDPQTMKIVEGGIEAQTKQVLENLKAVLKGAGSDFSRVAMTTIFLTDISHGKIVNEIYGSYVDQTNPPARQTVAVKDLPMGVVVEVSVIATV